MGREEGGGKDERWRMRGAGGRRCVWRGETGKRKERERTPTYTNSIAHFLISLTNTKSLATTSSDKQATHNPIVYTYNVGAEG